MSQLQQNQEAKIIKTELLPSEWTLWFSYSCDSQNGVNYGSNLMQVQKVNSWSEFMLLWKWVSRTDNFFINPDDGSYKKYKFGVQERKVDSINFFKDDIEPQWQFRDNSKYGYFNFGIDRENQRFNEIFQASVFLGVGQTEQISKEILGVRIVDLSAKQTHPSRARIQIWVKFRHDNSKESLQRLLQFQQKLKMYYVEAIEEQVAQIRFFNISTLESEETKTPKKQYNKKNQGYYKNAKKYDTNRA